MLTKTTATQFLGAPSLALGLALATLAVRAAVGNSFDRASDGAYPSNMSACAFRGWREPRSVAPIDDHAVARYPRLAIGPNVAYVVGVDIQLFDERVLGPDILVARRIGERAIGRPRGDFTFMAPRAAVDRRGRLHLLWAEADTVPPRLEARDWSMRQPITLWTSVYEPSIGWSAPRVLERLPALKWTNRSGDALGNSGLAQILPVWSRRAVRSGGRSFYYILGESDWQRRDVPLHRSPTYASAAGDGRRVFVAYTASDSKWASSENNPARTDANSVFIVASGDSGISWSQPRLVSQSGGFPAQQLVTLYHDGTVHLIWKQPVAGGEVVVRHVESADVALTWSKPQDLAPGIEFDAHKAVIDACGKIHLVFEDWRAGTMRGSLGYAQWAGAWSKPQRLFPDLVAMSPDVRIDANGNPTLVFVASENIQARPYPYRTYVSTLERE
jgi:hypothetical protein